MKSHLIFFVEDQDSSMEFYRAVLRQEPVLHVPGMTEFILGIDLILGLMPESGIKRLLGADLPDPALARGIPRAELYLIDADATEMYNRALEAGAKSISPMQMRNWGQMVAYVTDPNGHVLAFALPELV